MPKPGSVIDFPTPNAHARVSENNAPNATSTAEIMELPTRQARVPAASPAEPYAGSIDPEVDDDVHVEPAEGGWAIRVEGTDAIFAVLRTQEEAVETARQVALENDVQIVLHRSDGTIAREWVPQAPSEEKK